VLTPPKSSRNALRNLLVVLTITAGFLIYSYGWTVTDIDLAKPQEGSRQEGVGRALQELLSPNLFDQDTTTTIYGASFRYGCDSDETPAQNTLNTDGSPSLILETTCGDASDRIAFNITGLVPGARGALRWVNIAGEGRPRNVFVTAEANRGRDQFFVNADGTVSGYIEAPLMAGVDGQLHSVELGVVAPIGNPYPSTTLTEVLRRMVETIFMALIATTIAIPISVAISFFAAHNLMKPIKMPLGSAMLWVALFPLGYLLGTNLLGGIAWAAFSLGSFQMFAVPAVIGVGVFFGAAIATSVKSIPPDPLSDKLRQIGIRLVMMVVLAAIIGLIGGFGIAGQNGLTDLASRIPVTAQTDTSFNLIGLIQQLITGSLNSVGRMLGILGGIVELSLPMISGLIGAFLLPGLVNGLVKPVLRNTSPLLNRSLGFVLGAISGAFVMAGVGFIAMNAALLGLLPPLVAALLAQAMVAGVLNLIYPPRPAYQTSQGERLLRTLAGWAGAIVAFAVTFALLNVGRTLIDGTLPPVEIVSFIGLTLPKYVGTAMLIGAFLGAGAGGSAGVRGTFAVGDMLYNITRNILNVLRSIEPLIMALIFVIWVGIGPFAGVLALTLHSIASLGKLYSEQIETIDTGPIEALQSTGANHLQTIVYAVVPQIVPPYIAFTMYRWDINVRMSTIVGFVGGGGIGLLLNQYINLLLYSNAGVAVLAIAVVVAILDFASAKIRERVL